MTARELATMDLIDQADLIRKGEASAGELVEAAIARIEAVEPRVNALTLKLYDAARAEAAAVPRSAPFAGAPFLIKDLYCHMAGVPTTGASRLTRDFVPARDSELMRRYRRAGLVTLGKSNLCEFGTLGTTEPELTGPTRNPWNLAHSSGGSSGGAGAAVASGMVPAAHGGDGAGSIRIPASCCGVFGLKPTRGRITLGPDLGDSTGSIVNEHVLSRSVRDSAALLDATQGPMPGDPYAAPAPSGSYLAALGEAPRKLRIALTTRSLIGTEVDPACVAATLETARLCEDLGHEVVEAAPAIDGAAYHDKYQRFWSLTATKSITGVARGRGVAPESLAGETEAFNQYLFEQGSRVGAADYLIDLNWFQGIGRVFAAFLESHDVWLTPTLGSPPPLLGHFDAARHGGKAVMERFMQFLAFTTFANMAGLPAMSVPLYWTQGGLPVGSQFTGRGNDEALLLRLAAQLEAARPWRGRKAPVFAD